MRDWQRLDPRMLLVHPLIELRRFVVPLVGVFLFGASQGGVGTFVGIAALAIPVTIGVVRYLTTSYRIADGRIELQRGLLNRQRLSTPLDRVRTVDLTASVVHRLLRLSTVGIGTGTAGTDGSDRLELDALATTEAGTLRDQLLAGAAVRAGVAGGREGEVGGVPTPAEPVVSFTPRWLLYAPFTSTGLVIVGGLLGGLGQIAGEYEVDITIDERLAAPSGVLIAAAIVVLLLAALAITVVGYLVANGGLTLTRQPGSWHLRRGLLTTRETSIDIERVAGVGIGEPAALRMVRGARLSAIVTGLDRTDRGSEVLVPPAPAAVARTAATAVLGTAAPIDSPLTGHGRAAIRRRYARALWPALLVSVAVALLVLAGLSPWLLVVTPVPVAAAVALAADRARSLGHALSGAHLVARSGSLLRRRDILDREHVIGWTFRDTWFQRRAGLTTLDATTAGGRGRVTVLDLPAADATAFADDALPGLVAQFR
ncbi:PH domain-containing protein [Nocardioides bizhenqiangii]|uniref:PH domain-containing protein n=1 Tax=Nocardioides bizhenqiangii TaxID=3095076 RepID=A0ABZ0ZP29_9ACTN|nr:PH domain-containing protein [Nocardioides sp. HM61]WQQ25529.1 PH domain-containing protein [Nocardioides sp. HM61]